MIKYIAIAAVMIACAAAAPGLASLGHGPILSAPLAYPGPISYGGPITKIGAPLALGGHLGYGLGSPLIGAPIAKLAPAPLIAAPYGLGAHGLGLGGHGLGLGLGAHGPIW